MVVTVRDATDLDTLLHWMTGRPRLSGPVTAEEATAAARRLTAAARKTLMAGLTPAEITFTDREPPAGEMMPAEVDGMPVLAAFPEPPDDDDGLTHWTVVAAETPAPAAGGGTYRLCRIRRAGTGWEVFDGMPGAQGLTWPRAAAWFAASVAGEDEPGPGPRTGSRPADDRRAPCRTPGHDQCAAGCPPPGGQPGGQDGGVFTAAQVAAALSAAADMTAALLNPSDTETGDTIRDASVLDLLVRAASHLLASPGATIEQAIAASYASIEPSSGDPGQHWNQHCNDIGDGCGHAGQPVPPGYDDGTDDPRCPAGCRASRIEDDGEPQRGTPAWDAAIVATVTGRVTG